MANIYVERGMKDVVKEVLNHKMVCDNCEREDLTSKMEYSSDLGWVCSECCGTEIKECDVCGTLNKDEHLSFVESHDQNMCPTCLGDL